MSRKWRACLGVVAAVVGGIVACDEAAEDFGPPRFLFAVYVLGDVTDDAGEPVPGATVRALAVTPDGGGRQGGLCRGTIHTLGTAVTAADGRYALYLSSRSEGGDPECLVVEAFPPPSSGFRRAVASGLDVTFRTDFHGSPVDTLQVDLQVSQ